jgi:hypothetical protein
VVPDHEPVDADNVWPTTAKPVIVGTEVEEGTVEGGAVDATVFETVAVALALVP